MIWITYVPEAANNDMGFHTFCFYISLFYIFYWYLPGASLGNLVLKMIDIPKHLGFHPHFQKLYPNFHGVLFSSLKKWNLKLFFFLLVKKVGGFSDKIHLHLHHHSSITFHGANFPDEDMVFPRKNWLVSNRQCSWTKITMPTVTFITNQLITDHNHWGPTQPDGRWGNMVIFANTFVVGWQAELLPRNTTPQDVYLGVIKTNGDGK